MPSPEPNPDLKHGRMPEPAPRYFASRMAVGFSANFLFVGLYLPYFPIWLKAQGLSALEISVVLSTQLVIRVLASGQVTAYADRTGDRAKLLTQLYFAAAGVIALFWFTGSFWPILVVTIAFNFFFNPVLPLLDAIALAGVRRFGADYGNIRIWGSVVFILANLGGGWLLDQSASSQMPGDDGAGTQSAILIALIGAMAAGAVASFLVPRIGRRSTAPEETASTPSRLSLMRDQRFVFVMLACGLGQASHALLYGFGSIYWQSIGYSGAFIGALWAIGVIAEIILFRFTTPLMTRYGAAALIGVGCAGGIIRWALFPYIYDPTLFVLLQCLHALSFGAIHIGTMYFIMDSVPEERLGAAQGVGFVLGGIAMGVGVLASGPLYQVAGAQGFWAMAAMCALALLCLFLGARIKKPGAA